MSEAHEGAIREEKDPAKPDQKDEPRSGVAEAGKAVTSIVEAITALGKLVLITAVIVVLWTKRGTVEDYLTLWLNSANKLGFLGWSIERQISAEEAIAKITKDKASLIDAKFADGAIERAARNAPAIVGARILWVDEHPSNNVLERNVLEALGIQVFSVKTTKDALTFVPVLEPDLVISDVVRDTAAEALPLKKCPAHYFEKPFNVPGELATLNSDLVEGKTLAAGFSVPEAIWSTTPGYIDSGNPRFLFYSSSAGGRSASQCGRLVTNRPDVLLHNVISALEERRWQKLQQQPLSGKPQDKEKPVAK